MKGYYNMQVTFLIGNGFDLNLGLKTNYSDFLKEYQKKSSDSELIRIFKDDIASDDELWSSAEVQFGRYTSKFKIRGYNVEQFWECYQDFCSSLSLYLNNQEKQLDLKKSSDIIAKKFAASITKFLVGFKEQQSVSIQKSFSQLGGGFNFRFLSFNYTKTLDSCIELVRKNDLLGKRTIGSQTFSNSISLPIHVHGYTHRDMVFGVNDESQISDLSLFDGYSNLYLNQIIKIKANEMNESNTDKKAFDLLKTSDLIYIYGMSFGDTDALWWQRIFEIMKNKPHLHLLLHCYDVPFDELLAFTYQNYSNIKKDEFLKYCSFDESTKGNLRQRIHISRTNLFSELKNYVVNQIPELID